METFAKETGRLRGVLFFLGSEGHTRTPRDVFKITNARHPTYEILNFFLCNFPFLP